MEIDAQLVDRLIQAQFPQWSNQSITPVEPNGWDNRTFRLGSEMSVRLPSAACYAAQVDKEQRWLPMLAPQLPLSIPKPLARGNPGEGYPWNWSIYRWLPGETAQGERISDLSHFANALAQFLLALWQVDVTDGPPPGRHNFFRGGRVQTYDEETRSAIAHLGNSIDTTTAQVVWEAALDSTWSHPPVWVHGDLRAANLLIRDGCLSAVIDFGSMGIGDPACDLTIAWTLFSGVSRDVFRDAVSLDDATWKRSRGWALWKGLITLVEVSKDNPESATAARQVIHEVLSDHQRSD